jgi:hypothetical protein
LTNTFSLLARCHDHDDHRMNGRRRSEIQTSSYAWKQHTMKSRRLLTEEAVVVTKEREPQPAVAESSLATVPIEGQTNVGSSEPGHQDRPSSHDLATDLPLHTQVQVYQRPRCREAGTQYVVIDFMDPPTPTPTPTPNEAALHVVRGTGLLKPPREVSMSILMISA